RQAPFQLAAAPYRADGLVFDYITLTASASSKTFLSGTTYYIPNSYTVGPGPATFQSGSVIKYGPNAYLLLNECSVSFPSSGSLVVFTSKDDNSSGDPIQGSTGDAGYAAKPALWVYNRMTHYIHIPPLVLLFFVTSSTFSSILALPATNPPTSQHWNAALAP